MLLRDYFEVKKRLQIQYDFLMKGSKVNDFFTLTQMLKKIISILTLNL